MTFIWVGGKRAFSPVNIPNLVAWLDSQDGGTITESGGDVSAWVDKSPGSGLTFVQGSDSNRPSLLSVGGKQMMSFDGVDEYLSHPDNSRYDFTGDFEIHVVYRTNDANRGTFISKGLGGATPNYLIRVNDDDTNNGDLVCSIQDGTGAKKISETLINYNDDTVRHVAMVRDGNKLRQFANGVETGASPLDITGYGSLSGPGTVFLGTFDASTQFLNGELGEILMFNRALNSSERDSVTSWLKARWSIV